MKSLIPLFILTSSFAADVPPPAQPAPVEAAAPTPEAVAKERDQLKQQVADLQRAMVVMNARVQELLAQRNEALDKLAIAKADLAVAQQEKKP